jgi:hypothetical protein
MLKNFFKINANITKKTRILNTYNKRIYTTEENKKESESLYVKPLKQFFLKVHPDFFVNQKRAHQINQSSFQKLTELLTWVKRFTSGDKFEKPPFTHETFSFFSKDALEGQMIKSNFSLPLDFELNEKSKEKATRAVDICVLGLLKKAKVITEEERNEFLKNVNSEPVKKLRDSFRLALKNNLQGKSLESMKMGTLNNINFRELDR